MYEIEPIQDRPPGMNSGPQRLELDLCQPQRLKRHPECTQQADKDQHTIPMADHQYWSKTTNDHSIDDSPEGRVRAQKLSQRDPN